MQGTQGQRCTTDCSWHLTQKASPGPGEALASHWLTVLLLKLGFLPKAPPTEATGSFPSAWLPLSA